MKGFAITLMMIAAVWAENQELEGTRCYTIKKNNHWPTWFGHIAPKFKETIEARIKVDSNAARYVIPIYQDTHRCQGSWNKLYGASRCAMHHQRDSDRFVWRRSPICWQFDGKKVVEIPDCSDAGKLQLAAYAYDDYKKPFQNYGTLLKVFSTMVYTDQWYRYRIDQMTDESIYSLFDDAGNLMETQTIKHRQCYFRTWGYMLGFFFGGACPAPLQVDACYEFLKE